MSQLRGKQIVQALEKPAQNRLSIKRQLKREARISDLVAALRHNQTALAKAVLCELLGTREAKSAIPPLIACLDDEVATVRAEAAAALGKHGVPSVGDALMRRLEREDNAGVCQSLIISLGAVKYPAAEGLIIEGLHDSHPMIRAASAWSLGVMGSSRSRQHLQAALERETADSPRQRLHEALMRLDEINTSASKNAPS